MPQTFYWVQPTFDKNGEPGPLLLLESVGPEISVVTDGDDMQSLAENALYNFNIVIQPPHDRVDAV